MPKRLTLAASLLRVQSARVLDDLAEMLIKRVAAIHQKGKVALADYQERNRQRTDDLVLTLRDLVIAYLCDSFQTLPFDQVQQLQSRSGWMLFTRLPF